MLTEGQVQLLPSRHLRGEPCSFTPDREGVVSVVSMISRANSKRRWAKGVRVLVIAEYLGSVRAKSGSFCPVLARTGPATIIRIYVCARSPSASLRRWFCPGYFRRPSLLAGVRPRLRGRSDRGQGGCASSKLDLSSLP